MTETKVTSDPRSIDQRRPDSLETPAAANSDGLVVSRAKTVGGTNSGNNTLDSQNVLLKQQNTELITNGRPKLDQQQDGKSTAGSKSRGQPAPQISKVNITFGSNSQPPAASKPQNSLINL